MTATPAIEGWFTTEADPALLGSRCTTCGTVFFPPTAGPCRNPACDGLDLEQAELSRRGTVWSYTDAQYQPPAPYVARTDPYERQRLLWKVGERVMEKLGMTYSPADDFDHPRLAPGHRLERHVLYRLPRPERL